MSWQRLFGEAARHHGCVTPAMAERAGVGARALGQRAWREAWPAPFPAVWRCPGHDETPVGLAAAAVLAAGDQALAAGWTAAWLWEAVRQLPTPLEILVPHSQRSRAHRKLRTLRTRTLQPDERTVVAGIPSTTLARTCSDLSGRLERPFLRALIIDGRQRGQLTLDEVAEAAARRRPARGSAMLLQLCHELDADRCDSMLEHGVRRALAEAGYPPPARAPVTVPTAHGAVQVDIPWPQLRIGIETDGFGAHSDRAHLHRDQQRHNALLLDGWQVLRLGWWRFETDWHGFLGELAALFGQRAGARAAR